MASIDWEVVNAASAGSRSTMTGRRPARARKKADAAPLMPPPTTTASAVEGKSELFTDVLCVTDV